MMASVAPVIPVPFILATIKTELSSAVASTDRLIARLTQKRISADVGYAFLHAVKSIFLWKTSLLEIISSA